MIFGVLGTVIFFIFILSVLVLIHEWGHFILARRFGIKVEEFGFGFPPRVWGFKRGETLYSINLLPIGGFVKLYGEDEAGGGKISFKDQSRHHKGDLHRAYFTKPAWQRALVVVGGVAMNAILAVAIFYVYMSLSGFKAELPYIAEHKFFLTNQRVQSEVIIGEVAPNSPAAQAGMMSLSKITKVNNKPVGGTEEFIKLVRQNRGREMLIEWQDLKTNKRTSARMTPRLNPPQNQGALGVAFSSFDVVYLNYDTPVQKALSGFSHPINLLEYNFVALGKLIQISIEEKDAAPISDNVAGPVGIASLANTIVSIPDMKERILQALNLAGMLSISLAFFNTLPIPGLDGGRLFFILIEMIFHKKVSPKYENIAHTVGIMILLGLMVLITANDIFKLVRGFLPQ